MKHLSLSSHRILFTSLILFGAAACGGGGGGGGAPQTAPSSLDYPVKSARLLVLVDAAPNAPTVDGTVDAWTVTPALPPGLALDPATGAITGRPTEPAKPRKYHVAAQNSAGTSSTEVEIGVAGPAHFLYAANQDDHTITHFATDAHTGRPSIQGHVHAPDGERAPVRMLVRPDRRFLYVANRGDGLAPSNVSVYAISGEDGRLAPRSPASVGIDPRDMAMTRKGTRLYVASHGSDDVWPLAVSEADGALAPAGSPVPCGDGPIDVALDPDERWVWVANENGGSISTFAIDATSGALLESAPELALGATPSSLAVHAGGEHVLVALRDASRVLVLAVDPTDGSLATVAEHATGDAPAQVVVHPNGRLVYVAEEGASTLSAFELDRATGALAPRAQVELEAPPASLSFDPAGLYAYVVERTTNEILVYGVDQGSGELDRMCCVRTREGPRSLAVLDGPAPILERGRYLYAVNTGSSQLTSYRVEPDGSLVESGAPALVGTAARDVGVDPLGRYVVTSDEASEFVTVYSLDPSTGEIGEGWPLAFLGGRSRGIAVDPTGRWIYVAARDADKAVSFAVDVDARTLTEVSSVVAGTSPQSISIDPTGRFLYVTNAESDDIAAFRVQEGEIVDPPTILNAPGNPLEVRFTPAGDYALVPLETADHIATFAIDPHTGELTTVLPGRASNNGPSAVGVHRSGRFAYAAVHGGAAEDGHLSSYAFDAETARITDEEQHFDVLHPRDLSLDPTGRFLFSADEGTATLSSFVIDPETGRLVHAASVATGLAPRAMALTRTFAIEAEP